MANKKAATKNAQQDDGLTYGITSRKPKNEAPHEGDAVKDYFNLDEIFKRVLATADEELARRNGLLFWSGLAGGLVLGLSLLAKAALTAEAPNNNVLVGDLLYPIGFIILILGRYQLFTENTLTPMTLVLTRLACWRDLFRIWGIVFIANLIGAAIFAGLLGPLHVLSPEATRLALEFGEHLVSETWIAAFGKAVMAGWLLAVLVWLVHAAREALARIVLIWALIYLQTAAGLFHCIVGSVEVFFLVFNGGASLGEYLNNFLIPVTLGNTIGGVFFVAVLNYMQFGEDDNRFSNYGDKLSWKQWFLGRVKNQSN